MRNWSATISQLFLFSPSSNNSLIRVNEEVNRVFMKRDVSRPLLLESTTNSQRQTPHRILRTEQAFAFSIVSYDDSKHFENEVRILMKDNTSHLSYGRRLLPYSQQLLPTIRNCFKGLGKEMTVFPSRNLHAPEFTPGTISCQAPNSPVLVTCFRSLDRTPRLGPIEPGYSAPLRIFSGLELYISPSPPPDFPTFSQLRNLAHCRGAVKVHGQPAVTRS
jgi:hypothetical protein